MHKISESEENLIIYVSGELDHHTASNLREEVDEILSGNIQNIIFEFSSLVFMDSSGIGFIMGRYKKIANKGGEVIIVNPTPQVKRILEMSGILTIIKIVPDVKKALKILKR
ncbi:MAG: anti-sigma F factor antagonist [Clostridia bacterium]|nr:anti-sigma F factor antagonist [Clostridia bacterium]